MDGCEWAGQEGVGRKGGGVMVEEARSKRSVPLTLTSSVSFNLRFPRLYLIKRRQLVDFCMSWA